MAFFGRDENRKIDEKNDMLEDMYERPQINYYVPLDNTYVIMQMIATLIILIVGVITYLIGYKSDVVDPIASTKSLFINMHIIFIGGFLAVTLLVNHFSKSKQDLISRLYLILTLSLISMVAFGILKVSFDNKYTKETFEEICSSQFEEDTENKKTKVDIGLTGVSLKTDKEYYVDECVKMYNIFKIKTYGTLILHLVLNLLLIYQIEKNRKIENKKSQIAKDDIVLFDEEENVKY